MELKEKILASYVAFENGIDINTDVHEIRTEALENFEKLGFPSKKLEAWKYTSLNAVLKNDFSIFPDKEVTVDLADVKKYFIHDIDSYKVVFIDGKYSSFLSETTHDGIDVCLMSAALTKSKYKIIVENYFNKVAKQDNLTSLNTAFATEGVYIHIPRNTEVEKPIQIINFTTGSEAATMLQPRNLIVVEQNAHVQIIERHQSLTSNPVLTNAVTEVFAAKDATVDIYKIQNDVENASLVDNCFIEQKSNSIVSVHTFSFGGNITRNNLNFYQRGEHIDSILKGITIIEGKQHIDHHTLVHHIEPNCESHQDYKGIYDERSTGVFNGKVIVNKEAQKTNAYQKNNNVLVSDKATINAKPQLEIFADDVKCSHGCTIGQLDDDALFYMQQRGIPEKEGKALLMYAFANTVLESVKIPEVKSRITKIIANKLGVDIGFDL
ncbi:MULTISPECIES: Fe-S cluster assembly protein SufD [unclassified Polaribacter]|jgi:Fe-S cluster assembly protein SufD|uniref:Fe-S cluster assembly protein SufD n=1 Tax=unclassified Polaribacter TaxID=196858 RepID=UPI00052D8D45|nr:MULTISPECIES: Fe-S cluster assembly protein SufD [unclassified Polaribacter]MBT3740909.1 Fe-S cluster assembly protein SufD [Polaribacter sp.]KGL60080.1 iron-sulfur cluster assembly protein SufD [Polaribacter sp. Hel1_33_49]MBT4413896.1 Fe-S cluster assembly protein SufD [Polaribacter sp.]MDG1194778.1 Fe-S cluster assembly protein SufD [Polaribacter sp.]PKV66091.1 iron-regulated ABC transporter permease protein SufD [Polaribacter sp. Hel1_33_96]